MRTTRKIMTVCLALVLVCSLLPIGALAESAVAVSADYTVIPYNNADDPGAAYALIHVYFPRRGQCKEVKLTLHYDTAVLTFDSTKPEFYLIEGFQQYFAYEETSRAAFSFR